MRLRAVPVAEFWLWLKIGKLAFIRIHSRLKIIPMRLPALFLLFAALISSAFAADGRVVRLQTGYRTTASFQRLSEFLTGRENTGKETVLRSQPAARQGYYWFLRLENVGAALTGSTFELQVISPASPESKTFTFNAPVPHGTHVFNVGLTGSDWPDPEAAPVAWQLRVRSSAGELISTQSFLWSKPAAPAAK